MVDQDWLAAVSQEDEQLGAPVLQAAEALERQWRCKIKVHLKPQDAALPLQQQLQLRLILSEAIANAVRHGQATEINIALNVGDEVQMSIQDNGRTPVGRAPFSLDQRVRELSGTCRLSNATGGLLTATLPRA